MNYRERVTQFFNLTLDYMFPVRMGRMPSKNYSFDDLQLKMRGVLSQNIEPSKVNTEDLVEDFFAHLDAIGGKLKFDIEAIFNGDPAAKSYNEIIITYPGFYAIAAYRIAHFLDSKDLALVPRIITEHAHSFTGIDIHPAAKIGSGICIDHGTGVVIGETTLIGNNVKIYQGVTLGALSVNKKKIKGKRHPTIEDNVTIYAQATILGGQTKIGKNSIVGGNVWITKSIPENSKVYYKADKYSITENTVSASKLKAI